MNKSDIFFDKLVKNKEKAVNSNVYEQMQQANKDIRDKFVSLYVDGGYDMLIQECAELLDVEEKWLIRNFGHEFDYVLVPSPSATIFRADRIFEYQDLSKKLGYEEEANLTAKELMKYRKAWLNETKDTRVGLSRKRVFVHRQSFYDFIKGHLKVVNELKKVVIPREKLKNLPNSKLDKIKDEMFVTLTLGVLDDKGKLKFHEQNSFIQDEHFNKILKEKLLSGRSIKEQYVHANIDSSLITKVHDTQLYRWLNRMNFAKIKLTPAHNKMPVVRYLFPFNLQQEFEQLRREDEFYKENYVFNIPLDRDTEEVIEHLIFYVEFLDSEQLIDKIDDSCSE